MLLRTAAVVAKAISDQIIIIIIYYHPRTHISPSDQNPPLSFFFYGKPSHPPPSLDSDWLGA